jgi:hypothetical protein
MRGWIMPEPLVTPAMRTAPRRRVTSREAQDGTRNIGERGIAEIVDEGLQFIQDEVFFELHTDDTGGSGKNLIGLEFQKLRQRFGRIQGDAVTAFCRAVGVACVDQNGSADSLRRAHAGACEFDRRSLHFVRREHCSGRGRHS